nr:immunoglobulin heavy chain junction region [Macaca mulatta]
CARNQVNLDYW